MTLVPWDTSVPQNYLAQTSPVQLPEDEDVSTWGAAFRLENPVVSAWIAASAPAFTPDYNFDLQARLNEIDDSLYDVDDFTHVESDLQFDHVLAQLERERRDRRVLDANGTAGIAQQMLTGMLSPTILLPGGAVVRGVRAGRVGVNAMATTANVAGWAMIGASIDEGIMYRTQETRTSADVMLGIGSAAILGGLFGAGAAGLTSRQIRRFESDMAGDTLSRTILVDGPGARDLSAAQTVESTEPEDVGGTLRVGVDRAGTFLSPVTRNLNQTFSPTVRNMQAQLNTGGLYLEGNLSGVPSAYGGEVASLAKLHQTGLYNVRRAEGNIWRNYRQVTPPRERMDLKDFYRAVGRELARKGSSDISHVQELARLYRQEVFQPMLNEARAVGMRGFDDISDDFAENYFPRMWKVGLLEKDKGDLQNMLTEHFEEVLYTRFMKQFQRVQDGQARDQEAIELLGLSRQDRDAVWAQTEAEMATLPQRFPEVQDIAERIRELRAEARGLRTDEAKAMRAMAKDLETANKDRLADFHKAERDLRRRFSTLSKTAAGFADRQAQVLNRIEAVEAQQLATVNRAIEAGRNALNRLARGETLSAQQIESLRAKIEKAYRTFDRGEARLDRMRELPEGFEHLVNSDPRSTEKISVGEDRQARRAEALEELLDRLNDLEDGVPQAELRTRIEAQVDNMAQAVVRVNEKRSLRLQKMRERAAALDPAQNAKIVDELKAKRSARMRDLVEKVQVDQGAKIGSKVDADGNVLSGQDLNEVIDFEERAREIASDVFAAMSGENKSIRAVGQLAERGPELARTLDIDEMREWSNGRRFDEFLERDVEKISRNYVRQMGTDIEMQRAFQTVNPLAEDAPLMKKAKQEFEEAYRAIQEDANLTPAQRDRQSAKLQKQWKQALEDLDVQVQRLRHQRGVPQDPTALGYRMGRLALNVNVLRLMGRVTVSSIVDVSSQIYRHGLQGVLGDGLLPMIRNFQAFKMNAKEAKFAGQALDLALHSRMAAMYDIMDEVEYGTVGERTIQSMTNKFGLVSLMDHWNTGMKTLSSAMINGRMMRALEATATGRGGRRDTMAYLAANGIDAPMAARMWAEITQTPGGGNRVDGNWMPNTIDWADQNLSRAYRAALGRQIEMEIVVPGTERPNWMDMNMWTRLIAQFRSFTFSSTQRILMSSMQEARLGNYMNLIQGSMSSLALGALSYGIYSYAKGEEPSDDPNVWINEAINRSGILGVLAEVKNVSEEIPALREVATLGANESSRSAFANPAGRVAGPTAGLVRDLQVAGTDTGSERGINALRRVFPYQNLIGLSYGFDAIERLAGGDGSTAVNSLID